MILSILQVITAETSKEMKESIIADMQETDGKLKIIIATSTISMGVNIKGKTINIIELTMVVYIFNV